MAETAGVLYGLERVIEGAVALTKGITYPTLPLKATLTPVTSVPLPQSCQSLSIIKGRGYAFGGKTTSKNGGQELADNDVHVIILPSSGVESADYKRIVAKENDTSRRFGHSASVVDDRVFVFGGKDTDDGEPLYEAGRVWVFDTISNKWSYLDPSGGKIPEPRTQHASVASVHPQPVQRRTDEGYLPQQPPDPAKIVPEPPSPDSYGTVIIQGGLGESGAVLNDMWSFDISSKSWSELPEPPPPASSGPSLALVDQRLYSFSDGQTSYLDLTHSSFDDRGGQGELGLAPLGPWTTLPDASTTPEKPHPGERTGSSLIPVTTGQGRNYLLLIGGRNSSGEQLEDIWALQLRPEGMTAASFKDAARQAISKDTGETAWEEVKYYDSEGVLIQEGQRRQGLAGRSGFAVAKDEAFDGATVVLWGGIGRNGEVLEDGLMVTVDR